MGTDRCGDGIMDGPIEYTNATAGVTMTLQGNLPTNTPDPDNPGNYFGTY